MIKMIMPTMTKSGYNDVHKSSAMQIKALLASPAMYIGGRINLGGYKSTLSRYDNWILIFDNNNDIDIDFDIHINICDIPQECFGNIW